MVTNYRYNTLNQVIQSYQPDYDSVSYVYYDILSRPVLSQDGKQRQGRKYSYTVYDDLGRIVEVGQVKNSTSVTRNDAADPTFVAQFLNNGTKSEITKTWYDEPMSPSLNLNQTHLRNRIAAVSFALADDNNYQSATHYSYDIHGNVKRLVQDIPNLATYDRRFTVLDYEYDLISGNVNRVWFQKGKLEQFSHRYRYDADNRVTHVYTTNIFKVKRDSVVSQERLEARYFYLPTSALSRAELGHKQIQGIDYAYTLQGWLKDINGYRSSGTDMYDSYDSYDIGNDGVIQTDNVNRLFAHDGYASSIQYYQGDYTPVSGNNYFNELSYDAIPLYNGNISALSESVYNLGEKGFLKLFRYDKLNRIKRMRTAAHHQNNPGWETASDNFATDYSYDWNGNLLSLQRKNQSGQVMHNIRYTYPNGNNRLGSITSTGIASSAYQYDALGNLVRDNAEGLTVGWNAMGKVDTIHRNGSLLSSFRYSPTGQRQVKTDSSGTTFYIHDATGNVMCVYKLHGDTLTATERYLYGSKRLGMLEQQIWITANSIGLQDSNTIGVRVYEFTDHLGNVTYTAQDRKHLVQDNYGQWQYIPSAVSYTDYYPFGYPMPGRSSAMGGYRYFFNGQESDGEVYGQGSLVGYEFREYDTRLGRWWGVDPVVTKNIGHSAFGFCSGNPISRNDPDGSFDDWIYNKATKEYVLDERVHGWGTTPLGYEYVGPTLSDVNKHFSARYPFPLSKVFHPQFGLNRTPYNGEINIPKFRSRIELWLDSPAKNIGQFFIKGFVNYGYDLINAPYTMVFNKTIAGASVTPIQRMDALVNTAPSMLTFEIRFSTKFLETGFDTGKGLLGYNNFLQKSKELGTFPKQSVLPPNLKWQTAVGQMFQVNKLNFQALEESTKFLQRFSVWSSYYHVEIEKQTDNRSHSPKQ